MHIETHKIDLDDLKSLKVKVPARYHVHLHALRILKNQPISEVVTEALAEYLDGSSVAVNLGDAPSA